MSLPPRTTSQHQRDLQWPQPPDNASLTRKIIGFSVFGCLVRMFQLGILKKPLTHAPQVYGYSIAIYGSMGWGAYHLDRRQKHLLALKREELAANRQKEQQALNVSQLGNAMPA